MGVFIWCKVFIPPWFRFRIKSPSITTKDELFDRFFSKIFRKLSNLLFVWLGEQTWQQVTYFVSYCYLTTNTCKEVGSIHLFYFLIALWNKYPLHRLLFIWVLALMIFTAWKVSKYRVFSGPYFPAFVLNTERLSVLSRSDYYHHW